MSKRLWVLGFALLLFPACGGGSGGATVATPTFSPAGGTYSIAQDVTISCATSGAVIHYTVDGSPPTAGSPTFSVAVHVAASETIKAFATASGKTDSAVGSAAYVIGSSAQAAAPTFSPAAGTYSSAQTVTIATTSAGAGIYYTTDGSTPAASSTLYSAPVNVAASETLKAIASGGGFTASTVASAAYVITQPAAAAPGFSPGAGTYSSAQTVTISSTTGGAQIYYTTDGSTPTTSSSLYSAPVQVSASETLTAIATAAGHSQSAPASAAYVINPPAAPTGVSAVAGDGQLVVSWNGISGLTYNLYYSTTSGSGTAGTKVAGVTSPQALSGLTDGITYYLVITAVSAAGESAPSAQATATPQVAPPAAPTGLSLTPGDGQVTATWSIVSGLSYNLYYSATSGAGTAGTKVAAVSSPYPLTGLNDGTTYYVVITAANAGGESAASNQVSATPTAVTPVVITTQPLSQTVTAPAAATFTIAATGNPAPTYQWNLNGAPITGATSATYTTGPTSVAMNGGSYTCTATNSKNQLTSDAAILTVQAASTAPYVYWTDFGLGQVGRGASDGSTYNDDFLSDSYGGPVGVAVDANYIYYSDTTGYLLRTNFDGSGYTQLINLGALSIYPAGIAVDANYVYWADPGCNCLGRANLDGSLPSGQSHYEPFVSTLGGTLDVKVNATNVFWAQGGYVGKANLDGSSPDQAILTGPLSPSVATFYGLALDSTYVYFADEANGQIGRALLDGTSPDFTFITGISHVSSVAVTDHVFWGSYTDLGKADLDGSHNSSLFSGAPGPGKFRGIVVSPGLPAAPTGLTATPGDGQIIISWSAATSTASYNLYYSTTSGTGTAGTKAVGVTSPYVLKGLADGTTYYLVVTAVNTGGESAPSAEASATPQVAPAAPTIASATSLTPTGAHVQWTHPTTGPTPTSYKIYYGTTDPVTAANSAGSSAGGNGAATSAWVWGLAPTTQYYFAVSASAGSVEGPLSGSLGALTTAPMHANAISARAETTVVLKPDTSVWAWGAPWLGNNDSVQSDVAVPVCSTSSSPGVCDTAFTGVASISAGAGFTLALKTDGSVWGWGGQGSGQLGTNQTSANFGNAAYLPEQVCGSGTPYSGSCGTYLTGVSAIAAGWYHSVALSSDGTVWAWGDDIYNELGDGTTGDSAHHIRPLPAHVLKGASSGDTTFLGDNAAAPVISIGASSEHTVALKSDGTVWTWGRNYAGELGAGLPNSTQASTPVQVLKGACASDATYLGDTVKVVAIAVGGSATVFALKADGTFWSWGNNANGELGNNTPTTMNSNVPVQVCATSTSPGVCATALTGVTAFGGGDNDAYAATSAGTFAWGYNHYGTLGNGSTTDSGLPVLVPLIGSATSMEGGFYHSVALQSDHTVWTWGGNNEAGQLGIGAHDPHASPLTYPPAMR